MPLDESNEDIQRAMLIRNHALAIARDTLRKLMQEFPGRQDLIWPILQSSGAVMMAMVEIQIKRPAEMKALGNELKEAYYEEFLEAKPGIEFTIAMEQFDKGT